MSHKYTFDSVFSTVLSEIVALNDKFSSLSPVALIFGLGDH